jgi:hypothetical protein
LRIAVALIGSLCVLPACEGVEDGVPANAAGDLQYSSAQGDLVDVPGRQDLGRKLDPMTSESVERPPPTIATAVPQRAEQDLGKQADRPAARSGGKGVDVDACCAAVATDRAAKAICERINTKIKTGELSRQAALTTLRTQGIACR